jgi:hypothetical protein
VGRLLVNHSGEKRFGEWAEVLKHREKLAGAVGIDENVGISLQGNGLNGLNGHPGRSWRGGIGSAQACCLKFIPPQIIHKKPLIILLPLT